MIKPYDGLKLMLQNFCDLAFLTSPLWRTDNRKLNHIAVQRTTCILLSDKRIVRIVFYYNKAEATLISTVSSSQFLRLSFAVFPTLGKIYFSFFFQLFQNHTKSISVLFCNLQKDCKFFKFHRCIQIVTDQIVHNLFSFFKCFIHVLQILHKSI